MFEEAVTEFQKAVAHSGGGLAYLADLSHALVVSGKKDEALKILEELHEQSKQRYVPHYEIAMVYLALGEKDKGFEFLEKAYTERSSALVRINLDPRLDSLHSDPRYEALLERMGLE
jgi:tetratricopeptide (TPR) repeat protein